MGIMHINQINIKISHNFDYWLFSKQNYIKVVNSLALTKEQEKPTRFLCAIDAKARMSTQSTQGTSRSTGSGTPTRTATVSSGTPKGGDGPRSEGIFENTTGVAAGVVLTAAQFQALLQAVQSNQPPQPDQPPAQAAARARRPSFTLMPRQANANCFIDYTTSTGSCGKSVIFPHLVGFHSSRQNIY